MNRPLHCYHSLNSYTIDELAEALVKSVPHPGVHPRSPHASQDRRVMIRIVPESIVMPLLTIGSIIMPLLMLTIMDDDHQSHLMTWKGRLDSNHSDTAASSLGQWVSGSWVSCHKTSVHYQFEENRYTQSYIR